MENTFSILEKAILKSKGLTEENLEKFAELDIYSKESFAVIGNAQTLTDISDIDLETAKKVMEWAGIHTLPIPVVQKEENTVTVVNVEDSNSVKCTHCAHKQPHDYKSGDLCPNCGKQAEPMNHCYWCYNTGSGSFCRSCGAEYAKNLDYEIAVLLKREGVSKREIVKELSAMEESEKETKLTQLRSGRY